MTLLATGGCAIHWLARPHLFTLLFFVVTLHIAERVKAGEIRMLAWLLPLTALWVNLLGGFFVVFLVLGAHVEGLIFQALSTADGSERRRCLLQVRPWISTAAGCLAMTFLNPYGWRLHQHIATYLFDPYNLKFISEFKSMNFHLPVSKFVEPLVAGTLLTVPWLMRRRRFQDILLIAGWPHLDLFANATFRCLRWLRRRLSRRASWRYSRPHVTPRSPLRCDLLRCNS